MKGLKKILIANRAEIASRVSRTCREMGLRSVSVYAEDDAQLPHVSQSDEALCLGAGSPGQTYLDMDKIIAAARSSGADAIHPGYGFLSENATFARRVEEAGLIYIGPDSRTVAEMGDKTRAHRRALASGCLVLPGYRGPGGPGRLLKEAEKIGYPLLLKAAAGGGGRGMRRVDRAAGLEEAFKSAQHEATQAFGDGRLFVEKLLLRARHVEVQVIGDGKGAALHLGERDCSLQRRHQKIVEESPCPVLDEASRQKVCSQALALTASLRYAGAGTLEFLYDPGTRDFYFLEMNTRIQVEHPLSEMRTGLDLVRLQIEVAEGRGLSLQQADIVPRGHAIEARLYAEDPARGFMPCEGQLSDIGQPWGPGIRLDMGYTVGNRVGGHYDGMLGKLIAWAPEREMAIARLDAALQQTRLTGLRNNIPFLRAILAHPDMAGNRVHTTWVEERAGDLNVPPGDEVVAALLAAHFLGQTMSSKPGPAQTRSPEERLPQALQGFRLR